MSRRRLRCSKNAGSAGAIFRLSTIGYFICSFAIMPQTEGKHYLPGFDQALESVKTDVLFMANLVSRNFGNARSGFAKRDEDFLAAAVAGGEGVELLEKQVDRAGTD